MHDSIGSRRWIANGERMLVGKAILAGASTRPTRVAHHPRQDRPTRPASRAALKRAQRASRRCRVDYGCPNREKGPLFMSGVRRQSNPKPRPGCRRASRNIEVGHSAASLSDYASIRSRAASQCSTVACASARRGLVLPPASQADHHGCRQFWCSPTCHLRSRVGESTASTSSARGQGGLRRPCCYYSSLRSELFPWLRNRDIRLCKIGIVVDRHAPEFGGTMGRQRQRKLHLREGLVPSTT